MKLGLQIYAFNQQKEGKEIHSALGEIARTADEAGFSSLWLMDHFFQLEMIGAPTDPMLEVYTTLGYLAGLTSRIRLGAMVTGVIYRYPGVLAKTISTLDVLSNGRTNLGIGAAWYEKEAVGLGIPFPPVKERFERLEETLQIIKQMWSGEHGSYNGKHYQLAETINNPQPIAKPHPSILIGGMGEKKTLKLVAKYADACNLFGFVEDDILKHKLNVLKKHCEDIGRDYDEIEKTILVGAGLTDKDSSVNKTVSKIKSYVDLGFHHVILNGLNEINLVQKASQEVLPAVIDYTT